DHGGDRDPRDRGRRRRTARGGHPRGGCGPGVRRDRGEQRRPGGRGRLLRRRRHRGQRAGPSAGRRAYPRRGPGRPQGRGERPGRGRPEGPVITYIPSPPQGVWHLGPLPLRAYALAILAGIVVALVIARRRWAERGGDPETVLEIVFW